MKNILFAIFLSVILVACGGNDTKDAPQEEPATQEQMEQATTNTDTVAAPVAENATTEETTTGTKEETNTSSSSKVTSGSWTGKVVKLADATTGNYEALTTARVKELVMAGQYVGFLSNGTFYMVFNAAGNYDWKHLAKVASQSTVTIEGKLKRVNGVSVIVATKVS